MYSTHIQGLRQNSEGEVEREWYGGYETKPGECALIFMSLWVCWWYNTCSKFFIPDETQYVGYILHFLNRRCLDSNASRIMCGKARKDQTAPCFHGKKNKEIKKTTLFALFFIGTLSSPTPLCYIRHNPFPLFGFIVWAFLLPRPLKWRSTEETVYISVFLSNW